MAAIRIIQVPSGVIAPESIRKEWLGIEIPLRNQEELDRYSMSTSSIGLGNLGGYCVSWEDAVEALRKAGKDEIANFWENTRLGACLRFARDVCEVIE